MTSDVSTELTESAATNTYTDAHTGQVVYNMDKLSIDEFKDMLNVWKSDMEKSLTEKLTANINTKVQETIKEELKLVSTQVSYCVEQIVELQTTNADLRNQIKNQEKAATRSEKKNNIIIFVLKSSGSTEEVEKRVLSFISEVLKVDYVLSEIDYVKRLGKSNNKNAPIQLALTTFRKKMEILKKSTLLKGTKYSLSNDFHKETQEIRKKLVPIMKNLKSQGHSVKLINEKILSDGKLYNVEEAAALAQSPQIS